MTNDELKSLSDAELRLRCITDAQLARQLQDARRKVYALDNEQYRREQERMRAESEAGQSAYVDLDAHLESMYDEANGDDGS